MKVLRVAVDKEHQGRPAPHDCLKIVKSAKETIEFDTPRSIAGKIMKDECKGTAIVKFKGLQCTIELVKVDGTMKRGPWRFRCKEFDMDYA